SGEDSVPLRLPGPNPRLSVFICGFHLSGFASRVRLLPEHSARPNTCCLPKQCTGRAQINTDEHRFDLGNPRSRARFRRRQCSPPITRTKSAFIRVYLWLSSLWIRFARSTSSRTRRTSKHLLSSSAVRWEGTDKHRRTQI